MAEFGIVAPVGRKGVEHLLAIGIEGSDQCVPAVARACLAARVWCGAKKLKTRAYSVGRCRQSKKGHHGV
jgi:hypothetical protein